MEWWIADRSLRIVCGSSDDAEDSMQIFDDLERNNQGSVFNSQYQFTADARHEDSVYVKLGNYVIYKDLNNRTRMYTIMRTEGNEDEITAYCENLGMDLLNEYADKWDYPANPVKFYMEKLLSGSAWKIRLNEIESYSRAAKFEGTDTAYKRLISVAKLFDCEFDFLVEINASHIVEQVVDIKKKHGDQTPKHIFVNDYDLKSVKVDGSIEDLATALDVRGSDTDGIIAGYDGNGKPRYQWIKWAHDNDLTDTFQGDTNWIGLKWWQETPDKTNESADYTWVKYPIKDPIKDPWGKYTWIKFADSSTEGISDNAYGKRRIGIRNGNDSPTPSNNYGDYEWWFINEPNMNKWFVNLRDVEYKDDDGYFSPKGSYYLYSKTGKQRWQRFQGANDPSLPDTSGYIGGLFEYDTDNRKELFNRALAELKRLEVPQIVYEAEIDEFYGREGDTVRIAQHDAVEPLYLESRVAVTKVSYTDPSKNSATIGDAKLLESNLTDQLQQAIDALNKKVLNTYSWTVYADRQDGKGISLFPDKKAWMGVAENKPTKQPDLSDPSVFKWSRVQGADGVGVESAVVTYQIGDSGIQVPADTWVAEPPAPTAGKYLWTKTVTKYTDGNETTGYGVSRYGEDGKPGKDGKTTYLHTAYAWSADGTDRFTTVYPGENLFTPIKYDSNVGYINFDDGTGKTIVGSGSYRYSDYINAAGAAIVINIVESTTLAPIGCRIFAYDTDQNFLGVSSQISFNQPRIEIWDLPSGTSYIRYYYPKKDGSKVKLEIGNVQTIYTPAPSEDPSNAYPHYMGTYSDNSPTASTNPADYTWVKIIGEQGPPTGITESSTIPDNPYYGMLWKHTGSVSSYIKNATYRWNGSTWELYLFTAENISASTLSAICANLGTVTAGTINGVNVNGSIIKNTFKNWETGIEFGSAGSGLYLGGTTTIQDGRVEIESKVHNKSGVQISPLQMFKSSLSDEGIKYGTYDSTGAKTLMQIMAGGLSVVDLTGSEPRYAFLTVDDIIKLKNFNEKTRVIFDAGNYESMPYPTASNKYALGDTSKIRWIIINWAMYDPSAGTFYGLNQQSIIEYSSTSALGFYDFVLPYSANGGNTAIEMTIKRIRFPYENNVTYLQGDDINMGNYSKWWLMRKLIVVEG